MDEASIELIQTIVVCVWLLAMVWVLLPVVRQLLKPLPPYDTGSLSTFEQEEREIEVPSDPLLGDQYHPQKALHRAKTQPQQTVQMVRAWLKDSE